MGITKIKFIAVAIGIYLVWILATYFLEGRINLLQKPNPLGRLIYTVIANMIIGTVIAIWLLRPSILQRFVTSKQLGFQSPLKRVVIAVVIAGFWICTICNSKASVFKCNNHIKCVLADSP
jgi:hypothetical protein